jgi:hypothetical protein
MKPTDSDARALSATPDLPSNARSPSPGWSNVSSQKAATIKKLFRNAAGDHKAAQLVWQMIRGECELLSDDLQEPHGMNHSCTNPPREGLCRHNTPGCTEDPSRPPLKECSRIESRGAAPTREAVSKRAGPLNPNSVYSVSARFISWNSRNSVTPNANLQGGPTHKN